MFGGIFMFNKNEFANLIKRIKETYNTQEEFAKKSGVGRTYLSQYMNMKLEYPPKPKILEKLAASSNGITSYPDLMTICGYQENNYIKNKNDILFNIPILNKIVINKPILADEYLEGYFPIDPTIYNITIPDEYFYLKVSDESINLKVHNGDYALIHKQNYAKNGDIIVAIVNNDSEATLKKYTKLADDLVILAPISTVSMDSIEINPKKSVLKIIGKAIGQFGKL